MKLNARIYRSLDGEPVVTQQLDGKTVEIHYMNDTKYLSTYIPRGRFYLWTSDGKDYRLLVEKGFYQKVDYFFTEEINGTWVDFLDDLGETHSKTNRKFLFITLGVTVLVLMLAAFFFPDQLLWVMVGSLLLTMIANGFQSRKIRDIVKQKNLAAQEKIRNILTEEVFEQFFIDQDEYIKSYFQFEEDKRAQEENEQGELLDNISDEELDEIEEIEIIEDKDDKKNEGEIE